ncbi:MAG: ankyrin repeat domain-containing protein [Synergistaceae bacterium]|jgi:ankyrin repeat protein|nr:ankyrin repeat domain-containing protein [Synergistaceae bacterium]
MRHLKFILASLVILTTAGCIGFYIEGENEKTKVDSSRSLFTSNLTEEKLQEYEKKGADVNIQEANGCTPLMFHLESADLFAVKWLLSRDVDVNITNAGGATALMYAARYTDDPDVLKTLINKGADVNSADRYGNTPLNFTARYNKRDIAEALIDHNAKVDAQNEKGETALMHAAYFNDADVVGALLAAGANTELKDSRGNRALEYAKEKRNQKSIDILTRAMPEQERPPEPKTEPNP